MSLQELLRETLARFQLCGRAMARRGITRLTGGPLPVPDTLGGLVHERLRELPAPVAEAVRMWPSPTTIRAMRSCPGDRRMPRTPVASRPMWRTSFS